MSEDEIPEHGLAVLGSAVELPHIHLVSHLFNYINFNVRPINYY